MHNVLSFQAPVQAHGVHGGHRVAEGEQHPQGGRHVLREGRRHPRGAREAHDGQDRGANHAAQVSMTRESKGALKSADC